VLHVTAAFTPRWVHFDLEDRIGGMESVHSWEERGVA
jgi:hypothetical protein